MNRSFQLVEREFLSIGNSFTLFTAFFLLVETIICSKFRFHNTFPLDVKKLAGVSKKWGKEWFPLAEKSVVH